MPIPKFAGAIGALDANFGIEGHWQLYDSSAALNPKFAIRLAAVCDANIGFVARVETALRPCPALTRSATAELIQINAVTMPDVYQAAMWQPISSAPYDHDLELAVIDRDGPHALVFACRRILSGWISVDTKQRVDVRPTHWREWGEQH